jgi:hypothetical protein
MPPYAGAEDWVMFTWWSRGAAQGAP